jgi:hypothetical protein
MRIFTLIVAALIAVPVLAQEEQPPAPPQIIIVPGQAEPAAPPAPTMGDYQKVYDDLKGMTENVFNEDKWKDTTFRHRVTNKVKTWSDFTDYEKKIFCLMMTDQVYSRLGYIDNAWKWELNKFKNPAFQPDMVKDDDPSKNTAGREDVEAWLEKLTTLRKGFAETIETKAKAIFKEYNEEIPAKDQEDFLKKIHDRHVKDGLASPPAEVVPEEKEKDEVPTDG